MPLFGCKYAFKVKRLVYSRRIQELCGAAYPGHPQGCPNYRSGNPECPYVAPYLEDLTDPGREFWLVFGEFDLAGHVERMKIAHPDWSTRRLRCVLYWQSRSKAMMKRRAAAWANYIGADFIHHRPEAAGVNVYATAALSGFKLERIKNLKTCRHIALVGWRK